MSPRRLRHLGDQILAGTLAPQVAAADLEACAIGLARRGRAGTHARRELVGDLIDRENYDLSHAERLFQRLCEQHGVEGLVAQFRPPWFDGIRGTVDFACPIRKVIIEIDGRTFHSLQGDIEEDRRRDRLARAHGFRLERIGYAELVARPAAMMELVRSALS